MQVNNIFLSHKADFQKINLLDERTVFPKWHTEINIFLNIRMLSLCLFFRLLCVVSFHCRYLSTLLMPANHALATKSTTSHDANSGSLVLRKSPHWSFVFYQSLKEHMFGNGHLFENPAVIYQIFNMKFQESQWILSRLWTPGRTEATM